MVAIPALPLWVRTHNLFVYGMLPAVVYVVWQWLYHALHSSDHRQTQCSCADNKHKNGAIASAYRWLASHNWRSPKLQKGLAILFLLSAALAGWLEWYYHHLCPLNPDMRRKNELALHLNIRWVTTFGLSYWVDFGSLLQVLRGHAISPWDPDSDLGMIHPGDEKFAEMVAAFPAIAADEAKLRGYPEDTFELRQYPNRPWVVQLYWKGTDAHSDMWIWYEQSGPIRPPRKEGHAKDGPSNDEIMRSIGGYDHDDPVLHDNLLWIYNDDMTVVSSPRLRSDVLPVKVRPWRPQHINITVPANEHLMAKYEFGEGYMQPIVWRVVCTENIFAGRMPTAYNWFLVIAITASVSLVMRIWTELRTMGLPSILPPAPRLALP